LGLAWRAGYPFKPDLIEDVHFPVDRFPFIRNLTNGFTSRVQAIYLLRWLILKYWLKHQALAFYATPGKS